ncbi:MAG: hypothetical protein A3E87_01055 [Gammaproteobacteria bacterium RIFCSPHIGHO2_12_FULL_35_23]|nr:MAG: hypothetical protein A3E87_01055 [Gammaproteobacteria bacterium RIFCSPHIGHO2_12_FULL_35_23]
MPNKMKLKGRHGGAHTTQKLLRILAEEVVIEKKREPTDQEVQQAEVDEFFKMLERGTRGPIRRPRSLASSPASAGSSTSGSQSPDSFPRSPFAFLCKRHG